MGTAHLTGLPINAQSILICPECPVMEFELDEKKSQINKFKHSIDFVEAQALWQDENRLEIPARTSDELRLIILGRIGVKT